MLVLALAAAAAQPQPGELTSFGDWIVGCDNVRRCRAVALVPDEADRETYLLLVIDRDGAPDARATLTVAAGRELPAGRYTLTVDIDRAARVAPGAPLPIDRALAARMADGLRAVLLDGSDRVVATASLSGLAAAFLHMNDRQRRVGTAGALRRAGPKPDATVPAPPPLPRVVQPAPGPKPPRALPSAAAARLIGPDNARCPYAQGPVRPRAFRLDSAHSLAVVEHPCGNGAYNIMSSVFVLDESGRASPARFDANAGMGTDANNVVVNGDWDARERRLSSFAKGRGLSDCGTSQTFAWDGERFRLVRQERMDECRGSLDYITTWRAAVTAAR